MRGEVVVDEVNGFIAAVAAALSSLATVIVMWLKGKKEVGQVEATREAQRLNANLQREDKIFERFEREIERLDAQNVLINNRCLALENALQQERVECDEKLQGLRVEYDREIDALQSTISGLQYQLDMISEVEG